MSLYVHKCCYAEPRPEKKAVCINSVRIPINIVKIARTLQCIFVANVPVYSSLYGSDASTSMFRCYIYSITLSISIKLPRYHPYINIYGESLEPGVPWVNYHVPDRRPGVLCVFFILIFRIFCLSRSNVVKKRLKQHIFPTRPVYLQTTLDKRVAFSHHMSGGEIRPNRIVLEEIAATIPINHSQ